MLSSSPNVPIGDRPLVAQIALVCAAAGSPARAALQRRTAGVCAFSPTCFIARREAAPDVAGAVPRLGLLVPQGDGGFDLGGCPSGAGRDGVGEQQRDRDREEDGAEGDGGAGADTN